MPYRQDILKAVLAIHKAETENGTWVTKDNNGLYLSKPCRWAAPNGKLYLHDVQLAFAVLDDGRDVRTELPQSVNQARIILPDDDGDTEMLVQRTGEDYYENDFTRDYILPHVLAVKALCVRRAESQERAA